MKRMLLKGNDGSYADLVFFESRTMPSGSR